MKKVSLVIDFSCLKLIIKNNEEISFSEHFQYSPKESDTVDCSTSIVFVTQLRSHVVNIPYQGKSLNVCF